MHWKDVSGWAMYGGSNLGTRKEVPRDFCRVAEQLRKHKIQGLLIVGGFEAYHSALCLFDKRDEYAEFRIPICVIPATISNNVPGTGFSIGRQRYLILRSEKANRNYTTDFITKLFSEEGAGTFDTKQINFDKQQFFGSFRTNRKEFGYFFPFDRILSIKMAARAVEWLVKMAVHYSAGSPTGEISTAEPESCVILGLLNRQVAFTPVDSV
uniref:Phosphofructokinase domain-containing protein n=1 Tax=Romanomermis culicivorax TaxID=13658 RepID=A0A915J401_ROMCU